MTAVGYAGGDPNKVNKSGDTMTGLLLLSGDPVSGLGAATKQYTDSHGGGGGSVSSVFGRSGAVVAQTGDYTASQVGAPPTTRQIISGTGLTGGGDLSADRTLAVSYGTTAGTAAQGNDGRLSDARTPTTHAASHGSAGSDPVALNASQITAGALLPIRVADTSIQNIITAGAWWGVPDIGTTGTVGSLAAGTAYLVCLAPARDCTLAGLIAEITTQDSTGVVRFGLASDVGGQPGVWLNDFGTAVATSVALIQPGSTPNVALTGGTRYWLAVIPQSTTSGLIMRTHSSNERHIPISLSAVPGSLNVIRNGYTATGNAGALSIGSAVGTLGVASVPMLVAKLS